MEIQKYVLTSNQYTPCFVYEHTRARFESYVYSNLMTLYAVTFFLYFVLLKCNGNDKKNNFNVFHQPLYL